MSEYINSLMLFQYSIMFYVVCETDEFGMWLN